MSDTCQTPGCGHAKGQHFGGNEFTACGQIGCPCTRYTAPTETGKDRTMPEPKVTLSEVERETLCICPLSDGMTDDEAKANCDAYAAAVESIIAHRVAEALRDAGQHINTNLMTWYYANEYLRDRANSYDPTGGTECTCPPDEFLSPSNCALHGDDAPNQFRHSNGEELGIPDNLRPAPTGGTDE